MAPEQSWADPRPGRYKHPGLTVYSIPPMQDARWWGWTRRLAGFLDQPRTWRDLDVYCATVRLKGELLRHMLGALEHYGDAGTKGEGEELTWRHYPLRKRGRS